jgi:hypothetical protein
MKPLCWATKPPKDTGRYWFRCNAGMAIARIFWKVDMSEMRIGRAESVVCAVVPFVDDFDYQVAGFDV